MKDELNINFDAIPNEMSKIVVYGEKLLTCVNIHTYVSKDVCLFMCVNVSVNKNMYKRCVNMSVRARALVCVCCVVCVYVCVPVHNICVRV